MKKPLLALVFLLSPVIALAQTASQFYSVPTASALAALTTRPSAVYVQGQISATDLQGGVFNWVAGSSATADGYNVVAPSGGGTSGRWFRQVGLALNPAGASSGSTQAWSNQLLESFAGRVSDIVWRSNGTGTQTSGIWLGNSRNFFGRSTEATRALDPPNVIYATSGATASGNAVLHFSSTTGVNVGDYVNGSTNIPATATVSSKTGTTVTMSAVTTGSGVASGVSLSFVRPGVYGFQATDFALIKNAGSVKASNAQVTVGWCTVPGTYCSAGNDIALYDGAGTVKLVGREIDVDFGVSGGLSNGNSGGLFVNTFNGSLYGGAGNGPAIQLGGTTGYWTAGFVCSGIVSNGSCFVATTSAAMDSLINTANVASYGSGAIVVQNNNGSNGQLIAFKDSGGSAPGTVYMDARNSFFLNNTSTGDIRLRTNGVTALTLSGTSVDTPLPLAAATVRANAGFSANGTAGLTVVKTVRASGGAADCTLTFTMGLLTASTCP